MHEFGYCEGILDAVQKRAAGRSVQGVKVRIGTMHRIEQQSLDQAFAMVAAGTVADGAAVDLVVTPVEVNCQGCGSTSESLDPLPTCADCGSDDVTTAGGDEITLESIQLIDPARAEPAGAPSGGQTRGA